MSDFVYFYGVQFFSSVSACLFFILLIYFHIYYLLCSCLFNTVLFKNLMPLKQILIFINTSNICCKYCHITYALYCINDLLYIAKS